MKLVTKNSLKTASLYAVLLFFATSCKPSQVPIVSTSTEKDVAKVERVVVYRDTTIYIPIQSESHKTVLESSDTSRLSTSLATSEAWTVNGKLFHSLSDNIKELGVKIPNAVKTEVEKEIVYQVKTERVEIPVEVNKLTRWQKLWIKVGKISVAVWAVLIVLAKTKIGSFIKAILKMFKK